MKVVGYFIGAVLVVAMLIFAIRQIVSVIGVIRERLNKRKSSGEGDSVKVDHADTQASEKEVNK